MPPTRSSAVTGEIAVCSGTEGPGFTDMISAIACGERRAHAAARHCQQHGDGQEDTESGIQLVYQQPTTEG